MTDSSQIGQLLVVATPIGNLSDISLRAQQALVESDYIAAEDSRHSAKLLNHLGIKKKIVALHEHNERQRSQAVISDCLKGAKVALISDAGTPLISDPGYFLVRQAIKAGVVVVPLPGACAAIAALSVSGLASDRFSFEGFLPAKSHAREIRLESLVEQTCTMIFYESTHRIVDCLQSMASLFGADREMTLAKELTKTHEAIRNGKIPEIIDWLTELPERQKGEFVILIAGSSKVQDIDQNSIQDKNLMSCLLSELSLKQAAKIAAKISAGKKNHYYQIGLELQASEEN
jgi:16S rRNA (cytidine1402-2'-O)-methyltransferase